METKDVIQLLSGIPIGAIIAWVAVIGAIISTIVMSTIKLYKVFEKTHKIKEDNDEFRKMVDAHDKQLKEINSKLTCIQDSMNESNKAYLKNIRYSIVRAGEEYVSNGEITIRQLRSLEELFDDYHNKHGNGYVTTLMRKVRALPVIGKLDENDDDVIE